MDLNRKLMSICWSAVGPRFATGRHYSARKMILCHCRQAVRRLPNALPCHATSVVVQHPLFDWATIRRHHSTKLKVVNRASPQASERPPIVISSKPSVNTMPSKSTRADRQVTLEAARQEPKTDASEETKESQTSNMASRMAQLRRMMSTAELRRLMREYGPIALALHSGVFLGTLGSFYALVDYGVDVASILQRVPYLADNMPHAGAGTLAVAWGLTTVTGPVRALITISFTPRLARLFWGQMDKRRLQNAPAHTESRASKKSKQEKQAR